jgi:hypothetical protein
MYEFKVVGMKYFKKAKDLGINQIKGGASRV